MLRAAFRFWLTMFVLMIVMSALAAPVWLMSQLVNRLTDNVWIGLVLMLFQLSILMSLFYAWLSTAHGKKASNWLISRLSDKQS